jgi:RNA polymerase sigma factor (sigma-70 family)
VNRLLISPVTSPVEGVVDNPPHPDSAAPVLRLVEGDQPFDWEHVYRDNVTSIYRLVYSRVGNQADAEDLTSQVFLAALPRLRPTASGGEVHKYLVATARTTLAGHWRRRLGVQVTSIDDNLGSVSEDVASTDPLPRIRRVLAQLPANYRRILELRFLERCSVREAAASMGISAANARVVQHRALRRAAEVGREMEP